MTTTPGTTNEIARLDAATLAARIRSGELSAREAVEATLARVEEVNPRLNAVREVLGDSALAAADEADAARARGDDLGPLHGVPFTVKDNVDVEGQPTTHGSAALAEARGGEGAETDAPSVAGLRAAGAIPVGRTNMTEFGWGWDPASSLGGRTVGPWDGELSPGGSSGGEAVALATGMSPLGIGNDLGGSLRVPAHFSGVASLKPTTGRVGAATSPPLDLPLALQTMAVNGPMARRVGDLRVALAAMSRRDPRDPLHVEMPLEGPELPRRVAVHVGEGVEPGIADAVGRAARALEAAGYEVVEAEPPRLADAVALWKALVITEWGWMWQLIGAAGGEDARTRIEQGFLPLVEEPDPAGHGMAYQQRAALARDWSLFLEDHPLVLAPVHARRSFRAGEDVERPREFAESMLDGMPATLAANLLGLPAAAVPVPGEDADERPNAVQLIGRPFREDACLAGAEAVERAAPAATPIDPR